MNGIDRVLSPQASGVSTAVTVIVAGWFAFTFFITLGGLAVGA